MIKVMFRYLLFILVAGGLAYGGYRVMNQAASKAPTEKTEKGHGGHGDHAGGFWSGVRLQVELRRSQPSVQIPFPNEREPIIQEYLERPRLTTQPRIKAVDLDSLIWDLAKLSKRR